MRIVLLAVLLGTGFVLGGPRLAVADSCDAWSCQPGCIPTNGCTCSKGSGQTWSTVTAPLDVSIQYVRGLCAACGGDPRPQVQVTAHFAAGYTTRQVIVTVLDFNNVQRWRNDGDADCASTTCVKTSPRLDVEPRVVYVQAHGAGPGLVSNDVYSILCVTGNGATCQACCSNPGLCNDGNACTDDSCSPTAGCVNSNNSNPCNDGNACTTNDRCRNGGCHGGAALNCDDGNVCTADSCNTAVGCQHAPASVACNDGNACTVGDFCQSGVCISGGGANCDDGNPCTADGCNPGAGCTHSFVNGALCGYCNAGQCVARTNAPSGCSGSVVCPGQTALTFVHPTSGATYWAGISTDGTQRVGSGFSAYQGAASNFRFLALDSASHVAIQSQSTGGYLTTGTGSAVWATAPAVGPWETFTLYQYGNDIWLQAFDGKYIGVNIFGGWGDGLDAPGPWGIFTKHCQ